MFGVGLEVGAQIFVGCGRHSYDAMKHRYGLIEGEWLPGRVADGAATFFDEQDSGREIPFILRLYRQDGLDTTCGNQGQRVGDRVHGAALSGLGKC